MVSYKKKLIYYLDYLSKPTINTTMKDFILQMFLTVVIGFTIALSARNADNVHLQPQLEGCKIPTKDTLAVFGAMDPRVHCHSDDADACETFTSTPGVRVMVTCVDDEWMGLGPRCEYSLANALLGNVRNVGPMYNPEPIHKGSNVVVKKFELRCDPDNPDIFTLHAYASRVP